MASIEKRGDGYSVRWADRVTGKERRKQVATELLARELAVRIEQSKAEGLEVEPAGLVSRLLGKARDDYLAARKRKLGDAGYQKVAFAVRDFVDFAAAGSAASVAAMNYPTLMAYWDAVSRRASPGTATVYVRIVLAFWGWAHRHAGASIPPDMDDLGLPEKAPPPPVAAPDWTMVDLAIATRMAGGGHSKRAWWKLLMLLRCTGLRPNQVRRLLWSDVNMDRGILWIRPELGKSRRERRGRFVPLAPCLVEELASWGRREGPLHGHARWLRGTPSRATMRDVWEKASVPEEVWRGHPFYAFRRCFKTQLRAGGASAEVVDYLQGHGRGGMDEHYLDFAAAYGPQLRDAVALVPPFGQHEKVKRLTEDVQLVASVNWPSW